MNRQQVRLNFFKYFVSHLYISDIDVADYIETNLSVDRNRKQIVKLLRELMLVTKQQLKPTK